MKRLLTIGKHSLIYQGGLYWVLNSQLWFWSDDWQAKEREVDEDIKAGRFDSFDSMDDFIKELL